ncbi:anosmin-1 isoform X2 [Diachasmimorpha longicaudata]|uniref:anosmin-1 isoform X2 n=1 Tax=Diachasmimorpha longicaudata TaxID=58733 RepID=UPI0030B8E531
MIGLYSLKRPMMVMGQSTGSLGGGNDDVGRSGPSGSVGEVGEAGGKDRPVRKVNSIASFERIESIGASLTIRILSFLRISKLLSIYPWKVSFHRVMVAGRNKKWWVWWIIIPSCLASWMKYIEEYDPINVARCDAKCDGYSPIDECMKNCLTQNYTKPGNCPEENSMSPFEAACLEACGDDSQCPDFTKCCTNDCGVTCMMPTGLEERDDIPPIPDGMEIRREKSTMVTLNWTTNKRSVKMTKFKQDLINDEPPSIRYLVEERHVLGPRYLESRLSSWSVRHVSSKPHASIRAGLKTGHWYQFRVAAVNENGSKGYSLPSVPFKTAAPKNPREPRNLSLSGARVQPANGNLRILLRWRQPSSDVPIMFYKLFWSRFIRGPPNDSILVHHQSVPKEKNCYEIKNLEIGFQYFLQVQAISLYGDRRLASRKASIVFNSTDYEKYGRDATYSRIGEKRPV